MKGSINIKIILALLLCINGINGKSDGCAKTCGKVVCRSDLVKNFISEAKKSGTSADIKVYKKEFSKFVKKPDVIDYLNKLDCDCYLQHMASHYCEDINDDSSKKDEKTSKTHEASDDSNTVTLGEGVYDSGTPISDEDNTSAFKQQNKSADTNGKQQPKKQESDTDETDTIINGSANTINESISDENFAQLNNDSNSPADNLPSSSTGNNSPDNSSVKNDSVHEVNSLTKCSIIVVVAGVTIILSSVAITARRRKSNEKDNEYKSYVRETQSFLIEPDEMTVNPEIISIDNKPYYVKRCFSDDFTDTFSYSQSQSQSPSQSHSPSYFQFQNQLPYVSPSYQSKVTNYSINTGSITNLPYPATAMSRDSTVTIEESSPPESMPWLYLNSPNSQKLGDL